MLYVSKLYISGCDDVTQSINLLTIMIELDFEESKRV